MIVQVNFNRDVIIKNPLVKLGLNPLSSLLGISFLTGMCIFANLRGAYQMSLKPLL